MTSPAAASESRALALYAAGATDLALKEIAAALASDPECRSAHLTHALILEKLERYDEALAAYDRAALVEEANWYATRITCLSKMGRHREAIAFSEEAVRFAPDDWLIWYRRGAACLRAGREEKSARPSRRLLEAAEEALRRALALNPSAYIARIDLAGHYLSQGKSGADELLNEAMELRYGDPRIHALAAESALRSGRLDEAEGHIDIVVSARPDSREAVSLLLRLRRAQSSRIYNWLQKSCWRLAGVPYLRFGFAALLAYAAISAGVGRAAFMLFAVLAMIALAVWLGYGAWQEKNALEKPRLSPDF